MSCCRKQQDLRSLVGAHPFTHVLGWKESTTKSIPPALVMQHPCGTCYCFSVG